MGEVEYSEDLEGLCVTAGDVMRAMMGGSCHGEKAVFEVDCE